MPSVDARPYVDLTLFDRTAEEIRALAEAEVATKLPALVLRAGTNEAVMLDALAQEAAEAVYAIDRVPGSVLAGLIALLGVELDEGTAATTTIEFTLSDSAGHTVPAGTRVRLDIATGPVVFATDVDLVVAAASSTGTVAATAVTVGATANGTASGTPVSVIDSIFFVESAELASPVALGVDPEGTADWLARGIQRLDRLSDTLVLPDHFTDFALEDANVARATTIDTYDGTGGPPYTDAGHVTVAVRGAAGNLTGGQKTTLEAAMEAKAAAMLDVHVIDPTVTNVNVAGTVVAHDGYDTGDVETDVETALQGFLDPDTWEWGATVRLSDVVGLIEAVDGVDYVDVSSVLLAGVNDDLALTGDAPLANAGTLTITVNAP